MISSFSARHNCKVHLIKYSIFGHAVALLRTYHLKLKSSAFVLPRPDVLREESAVLAIPMAHRVLVAVEQVFKYRRQSGESSIILRAANSLNRCPVHHRLHLAIAIHQAVALCPAIAQFSTGSMAS